MMVMASFSSVTLSVVPGTTGTPAAIIDLRAVILSPIPSIASGAVSYTHLTLPTSDLVEISVVAVSIKKKKKIINTKKNKRKRKT